MKRLQAVAFFGDKIYYKKSEGFQTTTFTSLYKALNAFSTNKILHGALSDLDGKSFQDLINMLIEKQHIIRRFSDMYENELKTNKKLYDEMATANLFLGRIPIQYIMNN